MDFPQILDEADFSHNALRLHLNKLVERALIVREKAPSAGPGRPKFTYSMPHGLGRRASGTPTGSSEMIALPFRRLKRLCRFKRGGRCRETRDRCEARNCPQIQKGE